MKLADICRQQKQQGSTAQEIESLLTAQASNAENRVLTLQEELVLEKENAALLVEVRPLFHCNSLLLSSALLYAILLLSFLLLSRIFKIFDNSCGPVPPLPIAPSYYFCTGDSSIAAASSRAHAAPRRERREGAGTGGSGPAVSTTTGALLLPFPFLRTE